MFNGKHAHDRNGKLVGENGLGVKILHILDHSVPLQSGYTFRTRAILERQRALGWETAHVTSAKHELGMGAKPAGKGRCAHAETASPVPAAKEHVDGLDFYRTGNMRHFTGRIPVLGQFAVIRTLAKRIDEVTALERPDILHAHSPALNGAAALWVGKKRRLPVVYEVRAFWEDAAVDHGSCREGDLRYRASRALESRVMFRANAVTTICEGLKSEIVSRGIPEERVTVIPNAVDISRFPIGSAADKALLRELSLAGKKVVGFIGSFYAYEGLHLLVKALSDVLGRRDDVCLLLVGGGPQEGKLKQLVQDLGISDRVVFTGRVPHGEVGRYYDLADVLVYPRLSMRLTELVTPLKPLEAMARGKLVVASDVGGHRELIRHGVTALLFRSGNVTELVNTLLEALDEGCSHEDIKASARRFVEEQRNWEGSVERYEDVYRAVTSVSVSS